MNKYVWQDQRTECHSKKVMMIFLYANNEMLKMKMKNSIIYNSTRNLKYLLIKLLKLIQNLHTIF